MKRIFQYINPPTLQKREFSQNVMGAILCRTKQHSRTRKMQYQFLADLYNDSLLWTFILEVISSTWLCGPRKHDPIPMQYWIVMDFSIWDDVLSG